MIQAKFVDGLFYPFDLTQRIRTRNGVFDVKVAREGGFPHHFHGCEWMCFYETNGLYEGQFLLFYNWRDNELHCEIFNENGEPVSNVLRDHYWEADTDVMEITPQWHR